ncbi:MAG: hypothetical protein ACYSU0_21070 [Planctomycetota bacterium]
MPTERDAIFDKLAVGRGYATEAVGFATPLSRAIVGKGMLTRDRTHELRHATAVETGEARVVDGYEAVHELYQGERG